ncbi:MAG: cytidylate kinase-like family protein [candidate division Zixibacteria bacterium]|nr:cytidylate kinase-like family protein [candidate division Zixibacteria bacterium]
MPSIDQIINRQFKQWESEQVRRDEEVSTVVIPPSIVTVSREHGSRGSYFALRLSQEMGFERMHRQVIEAICDSTGYRKQIVESIDEKYRSTMATLVDSMLFGQAVDHTDYARNLCTVVLSVAKLGGVVLVGRGGSFILGPQTGFHIRVVCPIEKRIANLIKHSSFSESEAVESIKKTDNERREMIRKLFNADLDDPRNYDMIVNSAYIDIEEMVQMAMLAVTAKRDKVTRLQNV